MTENTRGTTEANFTSVEFNEIREKLITRVRSYYPDTYADFNKSSFGSLMIDLVSMVSEQLNFYTQFVANENYVDTARSAYSLNAHAVKAGKPIFNTYTSTGIVDIVTHIPISSNSTGPDANYQHSILKGTKFSTPSVGVFTSTEDVTLAIDSTDSIGTIFTQDNAKITYYTYPLSVPVVSGEERAFSVQVGKYKKFLKIEVKDAFVTDIIKVVDSSGNEYHRVNNLAQNVIYKPIVDKQFSNEQVSSKLIPFPVPRRYMVEYEGDRVFLVFGFGSESSLKVREVADPSQIALLRPNSDHIYDTDFDPSKLLSTDKFGVAPQNTILNITYRANTVANSNAAAGQINEITSLKIFFQNQQDLHVSKLDYIQRNISCSNPEAINGQLSYETTQEVSQMIRSFSGAQSRAVTIKDYESVAYIMPSRFGAVKRASVYRDLNDLNRNINLYVISSDSEGKLQTCSTALKNNLKTWIDEYRMISDTVDIYDALILNLGLHIDVSVSTSTDTQTSLSNIRSKIFEEINLSVPEIGESFSIGRVESIINSMPLVKRINSVKVVVKNGNNYSSNRLDIRTNTSPDGGLIRIPNNMVWEIKNLEDITGRISHDN